MRPDDILDGEAEIHKIPVGRDMDIFEAMKEGRAVIPRHVFALFNDIIPFQGRHGDKDNIVDVQLLRVVPILFDDASIDLFRIIHEVHFIDRDNQVGNL